MFSHPVSPVFDQFVCVNIIGDKWSWDTVPHLQTQSLRPCRRSYQPSSLICGQPIVGNVEKTEERCHQEMLQSSFSGQNFYLVNLCYKSILTSNGSVMGTGNLWFCWLIWMLNTNFTLYFCRTILHILAIKLHNIASKKHFIIQVEQLKGTCVPTLL